jgi:hypothetical protein
LVEVLYLKMVGNEWFSRYTRMRVRDHPYYQTDSKCLIWSEKNSNYHSKRQII